MEYILIDNFNDTINIVCKDDDSGEPLILNNINKAKEELNNSCQNGIIVPLNSGRLFTQDEVLDLLLAIEQGINPHIYKTSQGLGSEDFADLAKCKAIELNLLDEFRNYVKELILPNFIK